MACEIGGAFVIFLPGTLAEKDKPQGRHENERRPTKGDAGRGRCSSLPLPAADEMDNLDDVACLHSLFRMKSSGDDGAIDFDCHRALCEAKMLDERRDGEPIGNVARLAIHRDLHGLKPSASTPENRCGDAALRAPFREAEGCVFRVRGCASALVVGVAPGVAKACDIPDGLTVSALVEHL